LAGYDAIILVVKSRQLRLNNLNEFNRNFEQADMVKAFIVSGE